MASERKRLIADGSKRYDVVYRDLDGRQRWKTYRRKVDTEAFANTVEADKLRGSYIDPDAGKVTVKACGETWLGRRTSTRAPGKPSRAASAGTCTHSSAAGSSVRCAVHDSGVVARARLADSTTKVVFANLSNLFAAAVNDELIGRNPCRSLRTQSEGRAARRPAVDQADLTEGREVVEPGGEHGVVRQRGPHGAPGGQPQLRATTTRPGGLSSVTLELPRHLARR